jgi:cell division protease FtsH
LALSTLHKHRDGLNKLANQLLEREVIFSENLEEIFGKRPTEEENA